MAENFTQSTKDGDHPSKDMEENPDFGSSAPAFIMTTIDGKEIDTSAWLLGEASTSATSAATSISRGSKSVMKTIIKTANKANPLQFIPKPPKPPTPDGEDPAKSRKSIWKMSSPRQHQLVTDESEDAVLASVEERGAHTQTGEDGFRPAVHGETPPLNVPTLGNALMDPPRLHRDASLGSQKSYTQKLLGIQRQKTHTTRGWDHAKHRRAKTLLTSMEDSKKDGDYFGISAEDDHFREFDKLYGDDDNDRSGSKNGPERGEDGEYSDGDDNDGKSDDQVDVEAQYDDDDEPLAGESLPLLRRTSSGSKRIYERQLKARKVLKKNQLKRLREVLNPLRLLKNLWLYILHSTLFVSLLFFTTAWILYYYCGNPPQPDFLPGTARLSWWCNFAGRHFKTLAPDIFFGNGRLTQWRLCITGRQLLMLELARTWQFILIDCFILTFRFVSHFLGPWVTIFFIQVRPRYIYAPYIAIGF
jgi:hypothetical protein